MKYDLNCVGIHPHAISSLSKRLPNLFFNHIPTPEFCMFLFLANLASIIGKSGHCKQKSEHGDK